ncbi:MAG: TM1812 family CRISPR-associated protein [Treponema sp.]|jgi:hypothetical protein|nr:TM1812 family CRISPR-associated protein [Treponema sp.]
MKVVIITVPMKPPHEIGAITYPVDGNKAIEYGKPVRCPINGVLARTLKRGEQVKVIYILTTGKNSECEQNKNVFIEELEGINADIGAVLSYDTVEMEFIATKQTYNKLLTDLADKIPENAEIYTDITYGFKPETLSLFCALRFAEEFREAVVQYIIYGKVEFNKTTKQLEHPTLFDITWNYYLFKLMGTMGTADAETASKILKDFFAI